MRTAYAQTTKPIHAHEKFYLVITGASLTHSLLNFSQRGFNAPSRLQLSSNARTALGEHNTERFAELSTLKDGWHFGQGNTLQAASLRAMELFLAQYHSFPERCSLFLSEQGNLELVWRSEENETTSLEFYPDRIEYYIETLDKEGEVAIRDISTLVQTLAHAYSE
ncbi:MAG: hypothetical protein EAZ92_12185 [Candidatus Kapaibacterium sp.]|nr:MAG: hypothetical protein EAZ92_12185 [Candidatus Kapabacteria bacterium]